MVKRLGNRHCCVVLIVLTLFVILFFYTNVLPSPETLVSKNMIAEDVSSYTTLPQRRSLLIVGQGRSGTSFVSKMMAIGERVFEVYEPLRFHNLSDAQKMEVLQAFLTLKFTPSALWEKDYYPPFWYLKETSYHIERLKNKACIIFKTKPTRCFPADALADYFIKKSKQKYDSTVVKELTNRLPDGRLLSLLPLISDLALDADIRILHVVRDPRASINSRIKLRWFPEFNDPSFEEKVRYYCKAIIDNIEFRETLNETLKHRYKLILYRQIAARPLDTAREIFKFAGLNLSDSTLEWIKNMTNPGETDAKEFKDHIPL
ncbi:unnamed protein product [Porites lobata]|uniref:Sulfotransferase n=1 Tax=Porites lobata TaxID=104759 RepID=A0ABN8QSZ3_9CNID|nr:unnamed protein product [Porites lobata]